MVRETIEVEVAGKGGWGEEQVRAMVGIEGGKVWWVLEPEFLNLIFSRKLCQNECCAAVLPKKVPQSC